MGQMYGKKRIVFAKNGKIVHAGGKSYHEIGKWTQLFGGVYKIVILKPEHKWDRDLRLDDNAVQWYFDTKAEARARVFNMWTDGIGGLQ